MSYDDPIDFQIAELIGKYLRGEISKEELAILERWQLQHPGNQVLWKKLNDHYYVTEQLKAWPTDKQSEVLWDKMHNRSANRWLSPKRFWRLSVVAAALLVVVLYVVNKHLDAEGRSISNLTKPATAEIHPDVGEEHKPANSATGVTLITEDGEQIALEDQYSAYQINGLELNWKGKELSYRIDGLQRSALNVHHTIKTAVAHTYQLELADGTKVWLNAASSLRYPVVFDRNERKVFLTGEAYFDVAKDPGRPFTVITEKSQVRVLGTEFNIRAYPDEVQDRTSLFSGSVNVHGKNGGSGSTLKPGYEAVVAETQNIAVQRTSMQKVLAWKHNLFIFENEPLADLMEELSKWYGLHVHFEDTFAKTYRFTGRLKRYPDVNTLLNLISETSKVTFRMMDGQIWVSATDK